MRSKYGFAAALGIVSLPVLAHPGHLSEAGSLLAGLGHPFTGIDHVVAMVTVGLWAALLGGRAIWSVPAAFATGMVGGFVLAVGGFAWPGVEPWIAASVVVLGVVVAAAARPPLELSMLLVGLFGVLHGHAHGAELTGDAIRFGLGFFVATVVLHAAGVGLGFSFGRRRVLARSLGAVAAGIGLLALGGWA